MHYPVYILFYAVPSLGVLEAVGQFLQKLDADWFVVGGWREGQGFYVADVVLGICFGMGGGSWRRGRVSISVLVGDLDCRVGGWHFLEDEMSLFFDLGFSNRLDMFVVGSIVGVGVVGLVVIAVVGFRRFLQSFIKTNKMRIFFGQPIEKLVDDVNVLEISAGDSLTDLILGGSG